MESLPLPKGMLPVTTISLEDLYDGPTYTTNQHASSLQNLLIQNDNKRIRSDNIQHTYSCELGSSGDELSLVSR